MTYSSKQAFAGRKAAERLSPAAYAFYKTLNPFFLYEYETDDGKRYAYSGVIGEQNSLTFLELQGVFEELHRLLME